MAYQVNGLNPTHVNTWNVSQATGRVTIENASVKVTVKRDTYIEYNHFVKQYTDNVNHLKNKYMLSVPTSRLLKQPSCLMIIVLIILVIVPLICFFVIFCLIYRFINLIRIIVIVNDNRKLVKNPFERMIYCKTFGEKKFVF